MSSDYIPRLRAEILRAGAAQQRRSRWASSVGRPLRPLAAAAVVVVALVAVVLAVGRVSDVERPAAPQPSATTAPVAQGECLPGDAWQAPIVDEPIPRAIASRFAIFRDPRLSGKLSRDDFSDPQARKLYGGALKLRLRLDTGARLNVVVTAADVATAQPDRDWCAPPPGPSVPGICLYANSATPSRPLFGSKCFTIAEIEDADAWFGLTRKTRTVVGLAPDGVDRVTFDTAAGTESLNISGNVFAGETRSADDPDDTDTRFAP